MFISPHVALLAKTLDTPVIENGNFFPGYSLLAFLELEGQPGVPLDGLF